MDERFGQRWGDAMIVKGITDEDFVNYRRPAMYICTATCDFKCDAENGRQCCQNHELANAPDIAIPDTDICMRYIENPITSAIVFGGLEPLDQFTEMFNLISKLRFEFGINHPVIIYTGYNPDEVKGKIAALQMFHNIIVKFGRYVPGQQPHYDPILGVELASDNQHAKVIC